MSKLPVSETPQRSALSPTTKAVLDLIQGILPALTAVVGGLWVAITYLDQQRQAQNQQAIQAELQNRTRLIEAQRQFLDRQLGSYRDLVQIAARIVAPEKASLAIEDSRRLEEFYWGEFQVFAASEVKQRAQEFRSKLESVNAHRENATDAELAQLKETARLLGDAVHASIQRGWQVDLER